MALIRCLSDQGITEFEAYLDLLKRDRNADPPLRLLTDSRHSTEFPLGDVTVEQRSFESRRDFAVYLDDQLHDAGVDADADVPGMWEWLSLFYFDEVFSRSRNSGVDSGRYIVKSRSGSLSNRHLLRDPYLLYRQHRHLDDGELDLLLCDEHWRHGDLVENLTARARLRNSSGVLQVARLLYFDSDRNRAKHGTRLGNGGHRHFSRILQNLPLQFDLMRMSAGTIMALLPVEFDRWIDDDQTRTENQNTRDLFGFQSVQSKPMPPIAELAQVLNGIDSRKISQRQVKVRSDAFRIGILSAYDAKCCISNIGLRHIANDDHVMYEVEAAHIIPVGSGGADAINNGLALNRSIHWAFDLGMVWVDSEMRVNVASEVQTDSRNEWLRCFDRRQIRLPNDTRLLPSYDALRWHAEHVAIR